MRQNGRILLQLEAIEQQIGPRRGSRAGAKGREAGGLPLGMVAPDFELPDLTGVRRKLSEFRDQNVLLVFFNPQCGFCTQMAADLAALPADGGDQRTVLVVVSTGDAEENRKLVEQYGIRCLVLLQEQMEVAAMYGAQGTPMGYRIDGAGRIASELAVGAEVLLRLATTLDTYPLKPCSSERLLAVHGEKRSLAGSQSPEAERAQGQRAAPDFRLPRIDDGELSLTDFRGGRVLLVFSDPDCGPCDELAPQLQAIHLQRPELQVDPRRAARHRGESREAARLGLTFPIVLQKQWEVSLKYGMFATPIGYLIDERGVLGQRRCRGSRADSGPGE